MQRIIKRSEIEGVIDNYIQDMIFYLEEYGDHNQLIMEQIASDFCKCYSDTFYKIVSEMAEEE